MAQKTSTEKVFTKESTSPASEIIERCKASKSTRLDLGECGLREVPPEIWEMDWIEELILGNNQSELSYYDVFRVDPKVFSTLFPTVSTSSEEESQVNADRKAQLKYTANNFRANIFEKADLSGLQNLKKLRYLNLNACGIRRINEIWRKGEIEILLIGGNHLEYHSTSHTIERLRVRVLSLYATSNGGAFPYFIIYNLSGLIDQEFVNILDLSNNALSISEKTPHNFYPETFVNLASLDLSFSRNQLIQLNQLNTSLKFLRAEGCNYNYVPFEQLPPGLTYLNLNSNKINDVNISEIGAGRFLKELRLENNKISDISFVNSLPSIEKISLARNNISNLQGMEQLKNLQVLNCEGNKIQNLKPVADLDSLASLFAAENQISELPSLKKLKSLETLSLSHNQLSSTEQVKNTIDSLPKLKTLNLFENPLSEIPKTKLGSDRYSNCLDELRHHFKSLEEGEVQNNEIKLILIGNSTAGKTTLRKLLQGKKYKIDEDSTHGIVMETWALKSRTLKEFSKAESLDVHIWDFGGQEYYHETHKLFFSDNAVYVVVWEDKTNVHKIIPTEVFETKEGKKYSVTKYIEHQPYDYWLKNIRHYAPNCNILVIQNKIDTYLEPQNGNEAPVERAGPGKIRVKRLSDDVLDKYNVFQAFDLSLKKYAEKEIDYVFDYQKFERQLTRILAKTIHEFKLGQSYDRVKQKIREIKSKNVIHDDEYRKICNSEGIKEENDITQLSKYLTDTSVILRFSEHPQLGKTVFVNPVWVSGTIYDILNNSVLERSGSFDALHVKNVLKDEKLANDFIELMKNFELIFPVSDAQPGSDGQVQKFIAPQYLPEGSPTRSYDIYKSWCGEPRLTIRFPQFLPKTFMNGLLSKFASRSIDKSYFRYGVAFTTEWIKEPNENNINIIECKFEDEKIEVYSKVPDPHNLRKIFESIIAIYTGFRTMPVEPDPDRRSITVLDEICRAKTPVEISVDGRNFVNWNEMYERSNNIGDDEPIADDTIVMPVEGVPQMAGLFKAYYINETQVPSLNTSDAVNLQPPKLFISYSHKDESYKDELLEHLSGMRRSGEIKDWTDRAIVSGEKWDDVIKKNLEEADIILFLLSSSFIASDYIQNIEIKNAFERHKKNKVVIIPVPVRPTDLKSLPLTDIQAATKDFKAISTYLSRDEGWTTVIGSLRSAIEKWKSGRTTQATTIAP